MPIRLTQVSPLRHNLTIRAEDRCLG